LIIDDTSDIDLLAQRFYVRPEIIRYRFNLGEFSELS